MISSRSRSTPTVGFRREPSWHGFRPNGRFVHDSSRHPADALGSGLDVLARDLDESSKYRPAVIVLAVEPGDAGGKTVLVAAITSRQPDDPQVAVEIPPQTKRRLSLVADRSWVTVSEGNRFEWPGQDFRPIAPGRWAYGSFPAGLFRVVRDRLVDISGRRKLAQVRRDPLAMARTSNPIRGRRSEGDGGN